MDQLKEDHTANPSVPTFKSRKRSSEKRSRKRIRNNIIDTETKTNPLLLASSKKKNQPIEEDKSPTKPIKNEEHPNILTKRDSSNPTDDVTNNNMNRQKATAPPPDEEKPRSSKKKKRFGPFRAPTNIRTTVRFDYQPDVCKDYKETGYCGFGDSCKFLHDRSDYKAGWQLEKDYAEREKIRREKLAKGEDPDQSDDDKEDIDHDEDGLPFACFICRKQFTKPIVTLCGHYFCEKCVLNRMRTDPTCSICKQPLRDTLNPATKLAEKIKMKKRID